MRRLPLFALTPLNNKAPIPAVVILLLASREILPPLLPPTTAQHVVPSPLTPPFDRQYAALGTVSANRITCRTNGASGLVTVSGYQVKATASGGAGAWRAFNLLPSKTVAVNLSSAVALDFLFHGTNTTGFIVRQAYAEVIP